MLGQVKVADKANEIVAIPELLDMLAVEGAIVTVNQHRRLTPALADRSALISTNNLETERGQDLRR